MSSPLYKLLWRDTTHRRHYTASPEGECRRKGLTLIEMESFLGEPENRCGAAHHSKTGEKAGRKEIRTW